MADRNARSLHLDSRPSSGTSSYIRRSSSQRSIGDDGGGSGVITGIGGATLSTTTSGSSSTASTMRSTSVSTAPRSPSMRLSSPTAHRHSFSASGGGGGIVPQSPRNNRQFSLSQTAAPAVQDLLNNPPKADAADPAFEGREWHTIAAGELVGKQVVRFVEVDTGVEEATKILMDVDETVLLVRAKATDTSAVATFDYKDLNQYLLFATGSLRPDSEHLGFFKNLAQKAQAGLQIPVKEAKALGTKEPFIILPHTAKLTKVIEAFGSGVHRLIVVKEWTSDVVGILSQFTLVKFLWENARNFGVLDDLYPQMIKDLGLGAQGQIVSINGDRPLREALILLDYEGVTSLAVLDNQYNVVGNISTVDVKLLTKASSAPLLDNTCIHFISVILSNRGLDDGKDSFPVFHVSPYSTLAHTVAKLVATRSHRMWVTTPPSPSPSTPPTPAAGPPSAVIPAPLSASSSTGSFSTATSAHQQFFPPLTPTSSSPSVSAAALPGAHLSGRLSGVVSLTDVLNLFARASGLHPADPGEKRNQQLRHRRRSSSSSGGISRLSLEGESDRLGLR